MDVRAGTPEDAALLQARARWHATGDRLWSIAVADGEEYRRVAELVGTVLDRLRARTPTLESLLALDADPEPVLGGRPGADRAVLEAACAVRSDELLAARARDGRIAAIGAARAAGESWVVLEGGPGTTRSVEMHMASGLAVVASADPYAGAEPYALGETVLDPTTGDPLTGHGAREVSFADVETWRAELRRWREEIGARLDGGDAMLSDK